MFHLFQPPVITSDTLPLALCCLPACLPVQEEIRQAPSQSLQLSSTQPASSAAGAPASSQQQSQQPLLSCVALAEYAMEIIEFEVACVNTWLHRRVAAASSTAAGTANGGPASAGGAAAGAGGSASAKAVPCIRFLLDIKSNTKLAAAGSRAIDLVSGHCSHSSSHHTSSHA